MKNWLNYGCLTFSIYSEGCRLRFPSNKKCCPPVVQLSMGKKGTSFRCQFRKGAKILPWEPMCMPLCALGTMAPLALGKCTHPPSRLSESCAPPLSLLSEPHRSDPWNHSPPYFWNCAFSLLPPLLPTLLQGLPRVQTLLFMPLLPRAMAKSDKKKNLHD